MSTMATDSMLPSEDEQVSKKCKTDLVSVEEIVALDFYITRAKRAC
jgi:hypothetical protein